MVRNYSLGIGVALAMVIAGCVGGEDSKKETSESGPIKAPKTVQAPMVRQAPIFPESTFDPRGFWIPMDDRDTGAIYISENYTQYYLRSAGGNLWQETFGVLKPVSSTAYRLKPSANEMEHFEHVIIEPSAKGIVISFLEFRTDRKSALEYRRPSKTERIQMADFIEKNPKIFRASPDAVKGELQGFWIIESAKEVGSGRPMEGLETAIFHIDSDQSLSLVSREADQSLRKTPIGMLSVSYGSYGATFRPHQLAKKQDFSRISLRPVGADRMEAKLLLSPVSGESKILNAVLVRASDRFANERFAK